MREPIVTLAAMARRSGIPPEEFLTDLKTLLRDAPPIKGTDPLEREGVAHRLVTLAIEAYYAERAD
jgi:hypothetical protein